MLTHESEYPKKNLKPKNTSITCYPPLISNMKIEACTSAN